MSTSTCQQTERCVTTKKSLLCKVVIYIYVCLSDLKEVGTKTGGFGYHYSVIGEEKDTSGVQTKMCLGTLGHSQQS